MVEKVWTPEEVAEHYRVELRTLEEWRRRGVGPEWFRAGRHPRYLESALIAWHKAQQKLASAARA